ncbi:haloacid dehalogenase-like hydrolase domain-containing 5 isoform X3 [Betta splendens]|uniref:Haloacid dehalogenase-like hydrolase domain-containing 5 isoform X3 n=1 Tax=Betta splendens TaxID=158456 RepID=A0A9W2XT51_BETSP|nr:haloacid dehalogenase-like hydrolase domain-containing 5 isoform X3 [Betta splendens]
MWCQRLLQTLRPVSTSRQTGLLFDVDGVLLRGGAVIPAAQRAFQKLLDRNDNFRFPIVFVTNAGNCHRHHKAQQLSHLLNIQKVMSMEQLRQNHPQLDMVDHNRRPTLPVSSCNRPSVDKIWSPEAQQLELTVFSVFQSSSLPTLPKIEVIILFGEPVRWETNLQLLVDVLLTNGSPGCEHTQVSSGHLPVLACNMDLTWMAEAPSPRFGHGMFLLCLESVYRKLTGQDLQYQALLGKPSLLTYQYAEHLLRLQNHNHTLTTIYAVGDNLMTDIYGANLYNRYLAQQSAMETSSKLFAKAAGSQLTMAEELVSTASQCHSILVCTGVYNPHSILSSDQSSSITETELHGHRDLVLEPDLVAPNHVVEDVEAAVDLVLQQEAL